MEGSRQSSPQPSQRVWNFLHQRTWVYWAYILIIASGAPATLWFLSSGNDIDALMTLIGMFVVGVIVFLIRLKQIDSYERGLQARS
jgi:hypothetical protein